MVRIVLRRASTRGAAWLLAAMAAASGCNAILDNPEGQLSENGGGAGGGGAGGGGAGVGDSNGSGGSSGGSDGGGASGSGGHGGGSGAGGSGASGGGAGGGGASNGGGGPGGTGGSGAGAGGELDAMPDGNRGAGGGRDGAADGSDGSEASAGAGGADAASDGRGGEGGAVIRDAGPDADAGADADADANANVDASRDAIGEDAVAASCDAAGSCDPAILTTRPGAVQILSLTIGPPYLYFLEYDGTTSLVYRMATVGGTPELLSYPTPAADSTGNPFRMILADGSYVYATGAGSPEVSRLSILGGNFASFGTTVGYGDSLRSNSTLLFAGASLSNNYIQSVPKASGGAFALLVSSQAVNASEFEVDESFIYLLSSTGGGISRTPAGGGGASTVALADAGEIISGLALGADQVVFASSTRVGRVLAAGGSASTLDQGSAYGLISDGTSAFYFHPSAVGAGGAPSCFSNSDLFAVPIAGGTRRHLASDVGNDAGGCAFDVVQDGAALYWVDGEKRTIKKANK